MRGRGLWWLAAGFAFWCCGAGVCLGQDSDVGTSAMPDPTAAASIAVQVSSDGDYSWKLDKLDQGRITAAMGIKRIMIAPGQHEITARSADGKMAFDHVLPGVQGKQYVVKITMKIGQGGRLLSTPSAPSRTPLSRTSPRSLPPAPATSAAPMPTSMGGRPDPYAGNPDMFVRITPQARSHGTSRIIGARKPSASEGWQLTLIALAVRGTYYDIKVQVVMQGVGSAGSTVELPEAQPGTFPGVYTTTASELGKQAVVCYTARPSSQKAQRWTGTFNIQTGSTPGVVAFVPAHEPTLEPASDAPCGGLNAVKAAPVVEAAAASDTADAGADPVEAKLALARGSQFYNARRYSEARPLLITACNANISTDACNSVGFMYQSHMGVATDYAMARQYYLKSCNDDSSFSCNNLGTLYRDGLGVPRDDVQAASLFEKGCDAGVPEGCAAAGRLYMDHVGVPQDDARALNLFKRACEADLGPGCGDEAIMYARGRVVPKDLPFAASLFTRGCGLGSPNSCFSIGMMYRRGDGVRADPVKSNEYFSKACTMGDQESCGMVH